MTSDPQYPWTDKKEDEKGNEKELSAAYIHAQYRDVNSFRSSHPALDIPVYVNGDITAFGHGDQLSFMKKRFKEYFNNKVYLGLGNHDYENNVNDCANNGCARDSVLTYLRMTKDLIARGNIDYRSSTGAGKFRESYAGSFAHSEWHNNLHVVQANNSPVYATKFESGVSHVNKKQFNINSSWNFIDNKMAFASNWGKVNILVTHKPNGWKNFSAADAEAFRAMLKKHKVAAVFAGHLHENHGIYSNPDYFGDTPVFLSGSASYETYLIVESVREQKKLRVFSVRNNNHKAKTLLREIDY
nr:metallophosphoesterase [Pseudomonas gregormendelii]